MNLSLLEMPNGNTPLDDLATLRETWIERLEELVKEWEQKDSTHLKTSH